METNLLLPPLQYCRCKTSLSLSVCVVFCGPWKKSQYMWKQKSCRNRQKWEGARHSYTLLTKGLPRSAPFHTAPLSNFIPVFLWILQEVLLPGKVFEEKNGYMGNRANLQYLLMIFQFLECKIYWCKTEIAPGRIHFVVEVFTNKNFLPRTYWGKSDISGWFWYVFWTAELCKAAHRNCDLQASFSVKTEGLSLSPLPVALVCFPAIWTEGASLKTWSLQTALWSGTGSDL